MNTKTFQMVTCREGDLTRDLPRMEVVVSWADYVRDSREISAKKAVRNLTPERAEKFSTPFENEEKTAVSADAATTCGESEKLKNGRLSSLSASGDASARRGATARVHTEGINPAARVLGQVQDSRCTNEKSVFGRKLLDSNNLRKTETPKTGAFRRTSMYKTGQWGGSGASAEATATEVGAASAEAKATARVLSLLRA